MKIGDVVKVNSANRIDHGRVGYINRPMLDKWEVALYEVPGRKKFLTWIFADSELELTGEVEESALRM
jgi:hypothetical protein